NISTTHTMSTLFPYTTLFRSELLARLHRRDTEQDNCVRTYAATYAHSFALGLIRVLQHLEPAHQSSAASLKSKAAPFSCFATATDRKSTRLNSSHQIISYAVF